MPVKILALIDCCRKCPHRIYTSGGKYSCGLVNQPIIDSTIVASFCTLPDYPSVVIADMEKKNLSLQAHTKNC